MSEEIECPKHTAWLYLHCAKDGCCDICKELDGWFYFQGNHEEPYPISQHDKCRCYWNDYLIEGLYRFQREEMLNRNADVKQLWYNALVEIAAWDDKIADAQAVLDGLIGDKAAADAAAEQYNTAANQAMDAAQQIIDSNDELTEEQQNQVDELLFSAEDYLKKAEDELDRASDLQHEIYGQESAIKSKNDERDAEVYKRDEADGKLKELEPCLSLRCIEDEVEAMGGNRVKMNF